MTHKPKQHPTTDAPDFGVWFSAPAWMPHDPLSAAVVAAARLRHRMPPDIEVHDQSRDVRLYSTHAIVRLEFRSGARLEGLLARYVLRQRYWGGPTRSLVAKIWLFGWGNVVAFRRLFHRGTSREEGDEIRRLAHAALKGTNLARLRLSVPGTSHDVTAGSARRSRKASSRRK